MRSRQLRFGFTFLILTAGLPWFGCGNDTTTPPSGATQSATVENNLVFTREDMTTVQFPAEVLNYVWCGDWEENTIRDMTLHVLVGTVDPDQPRWSLRAVIRDVDVEVPYQFPNYFVWNKPDSVHMFMIDPPNELATDQEDASGTITFHELPCPLGGALDFEIDAVLGSEFGDGSTVSVSGTFKASATTRPGKVAP